jgi:hypothetical protein
MSSASASLPTSNTIVSVPMEYVPPVDGTGMYVDAVPTSAPNGISCPCGSRKNYVYSRSNFRVHIKCETHRQWLELLNSERLNYYHEAIQSRAQIKECQIRIATMQKEIRKLKMLLKKKEKESKEKEVQVQYMETNDLIDFS